MKTTKRIIIIALFTLCIGIPAAIAGACTACQGTGKGNQPCFQCNGKGSNGNFACQTCKGTGKSKCFQCGGTGQSK